jgi:hypothetical protein
MTTCTSIDADLLALLDLGASIVRVAPGGKVPLGRSWPTLATTDPGTIAEWLATGHNIGLLCGSAGLIDIEYDDLAGAEMFRLLETADGTPLHEIETPCWSSQRGMHHLFRIDGPIPPCGWVKRGGLEFRLGGRPAQSVLPPSIHPSGRPYSWLTSPQQCSPARVTLCDFHIAAPHANEIAFQNNS